MVTPTKKPCSICGKGLLLENPYGKALWVCSGCSKVENDCVCEERSK